MVLRRFADPVLRASSAVSSEMVRLTYLYLLSATFWLLIGTAFGLIAALKLNWPDILAVSWLSFGRIRPVHTNTLFWGWSSMALVGLALYVVSRTSRTPLWRPQLSLIALGLWHLAVLLGLFTLAGGATRGPQEYREWIWPIAVLFGSGLILNGINLFQTVARRQIDEIYISNWYILGGFVWTAILFTTGYAGFYQRGLGNTIIQGYYMHNGVGMWFTQLAIGVTYYTLPRQLNRPIYSYSLGVLGFWTNMLFYTVIGTHHFIFSPIPWWLQTTAIVFSVGMMVPVWSGTGNFLLTFRGAPRAVSRSYTLPFLLTGIIGYAAASTQGTLEAFKSANIYWHFTNFTVGHSHLAMYGFIAFIIWGGIYALIPRLTGREPPPVGVGIHFWLALIGVIIYVLSISLAGIWQGFSWVAEESFIRSVEAAEPMWLWRSIGGFLMVGSHVMFAVNLWMMRPRAESSQPTWAEDTV
ncbi:cbb3-type cytochrome c oxidase subunit I [Candidatus Entotheonella palauensis]|nr:cbb3-type cytochrome c oxidase subunit I [Candidatus Entotheonella palauensis]